MVRHSLSYPSLSRSPGDGTIDSILLSSFEEYLLKVKGIIDTKPQRQVATSFLYFLQASKCRLEDVGAGQIQTFITEQGLHYTRRTLASIASFLRGFLRYLAFTKRLPCDLSEAVRRPYCFQGERQPRYLQDWQVKQIISSAKRETPQEKRDFAVLLLLSIYGLRSNEVVGLKLDDLHWRAGKLLISSRKCGDAMELPLVGEVAQALIEYLQVRPASDSRGIFLSVFKPYPPLTGSGAIHAIAAKAIRRCSFTVPRPGAHTFRYSRAQALFAAERSLPEIACALGHRDLRTTLGYLSFTVHPLREVALNAGEELA
jgi:site-specific recombinase XerD